MSLQSRLVGCGEGESRRKNSYGDSLPLVECAADARFEKTSSSTGGFQGLPSESFLLPSPGRWSAGLKTQRRYCPVGFRGWLSLSSSGEVVLSQPQYSRNQFTF